MTDVLEETGIQPLEALILDEPEHAPVPYWFATKNGWFSNVPTLFGTAHVPAEKTPPTLPEHPASFVFSEEKVPAFIFTQALDFFRKVYNEHKTEATTYICRDPEGTYSLFIPHQYVTGASVNHKVEAGEMKERNAVGTIHSHCMFSAFHSGTDTHDMGKMPGLHVTIGMVLNDQPEYAVALAVGEQRFDTQLEHVIDMNVPEDAKGYNTAPDHWLHFVHPNKPAPWQGGISTTYKGKGKNIAGFKYPGRPVQNYGGYGHMWDDDGWFNGGYNHYNPSTDERDWSLPESESILEEEAIVLAQQGFRLQYTIVNDPKGAEAWLAGRDAALKEVKNVRNLGLVEEDDD